MAQYILNMGGTDEASYSAVVDVFKVTANGVEHITDHALSLSVAREHIATASCGEYMLAMGGDYGGVSGTNYNTVDVFKVTANGIEQITDHGLSLSAPRSILAAASCGNYILAMGGYNGDGGGPQNTVDVFKVTSGGIEQITDHGLSLSVPRYYLSSASCGEYVLAMGGRNGSTYSNTVDVFKVTANGVEQITDHGLSLSEARRTTAAAAGNYVLAMGGYDGSQFCDTVDVFKVTENGVEAVPDHGLSLSVGRFTYGAGCGDYILAMGGRNGSTYSNAVDVFKVTANGVEHILDHGLSLSAPRYLLTAASCGEYILAMGGATTGSVGSHLSDAVDVFQVL